MPSPDMVYGALPPPGCDPSGLGEALPAQSRPSPFRPAAPKAGPPGEHGAEALGEKEVGVPGRLAGGGSWLWRCLPVCITSGPQTSLDDRPRALSLGSPALQAWHTLSSHQVTLPTRRRHPCTWQQMGGGRTCLVAWRGPEGD